MYHASTNYLVQIIITLETTLLYLPSKLLVEAVGRGDELAPRTNFCAGMTSRSHLNIPFRGVCLSVQNSKIFFTYFGTISND